MEVVSISVAVAISLFVSLADVLFVANEFDIRDLDVASGDAVPSRSICFGSLEF